MRYRVVWLEFTHQFRKTGVQKVESANMIIIGYNSPRIKLNIFVRMALTTFNRLSKSDLLTVDLLS